MLSDPYLKESGFFYRYDHPSEGPVAAVSHQVRFSDTPVNRLRPPPRLGEHTQDILDALEFASTSSSAAPEG